MSPGMVRLAAASVALVAAAPALAGDADPRSDGSPALSTPARGAGATPEATSPLDLGAGDLAAPIAFQPSLGAMTATPRPGDLGLAHDHGSGHGEGGSHHGGWMGTTMLVVMVAMMATVGVVMMTRGTRLSPVSSGGPASLALPQSGPARFGPAGG